ncbi:M15 family metallopeptidase [Candidatus Peregrinibacteria bacterium]|nr:M15 family metallopeptidase [Candidatus Peregrinibacteria bacterium]
MKNSFSFFLTTIFVLYFLCVSGEFTFAYENNYKFNGKELDPETNLYYYGARYYNPKIGQFASQDPWEGDLTDPQSFNKYSYVRNNPLRYVDPSGAIKKDASVLSKLGSILTFDNFGEGDGWLAKSANNYTDNRSKETLSDAVNKMATAIEKFIKDPASFSDETWDSKTTERIQELDPKVQVPATDFINTAEQEQDTQLRVGDGYRSIAEQNALYNQSRTDPPAGPWRTNAKGGESYHNYGLAIDVYEMKNGQPTWKVLTQSVVNIAKSFGFEWGGDWKKPDTDPPHFQMTFGQSKDDLQKKNAKK